ncbi:hypothetical protein EDB86DRAFT_2880532 [Lactarius hatsudake]|nr:hypothetical protein EDB86DRAFT_2880532 [Lactarius hatsudake]
MRLWWVPNKSPSVKDAFHDHIVPAHRLPGHQLVDGAFKLFKASAGGVENNGGDSDSGSSTDGRTQFHYDPPVCQPG